VVVKCLKCLTILSPVSCYMTGWLPDIWYCNSIFNSPDNNMLITWHWYVILDTWSLTLDIWHWYLTCYHLTPDIWHLIYDTWQLTCYHLLDMLSHGTSILDLILWHLTGHYCTWHLYYIAYSWLSLLRELGMIIILLPDLWYSCAPELLYSWTPITGGFLILFS